MGQTCCSSDDPDATAPITSNTTRKQPELHDGTLDYHSSESDSEFNMDANDNHLNPTEYSAEMTPENPHTTHEKEKAKNGFQDAIQSGNDSLVMHFVQEYPELNLVQLIFENGDNPLQVAVNNKCHNLILYLLENGASPNAQNMKNGETALHTAVRTRNVKVVALLSKYLADVNITNNKYETPLTIASDNGDDDIIELLAPDTQIVIRERLASFNSDNSDCHTAPTPTNIAIYDVVDNILSVNSGTTPNFNVMDDNYNISLDIAAQRSQPRVSDNRTFDEKLDACDKLKMDAVRVARQNPFGRLKHNNTKKALAEMQKISDAKDGLPKLAAWLEKKQRSMPYQYQKRWVIVKGSHLLWSDIQRDIKNVKDVNERKKFNNSLNIMSITEIRVVTKGKTERKFAFNVGSTKQKNEYVWRCATKSDRDFWVKSLKKHVAHVKSLLTYLGTK